jgi:hypothetical protein
VFSSPVGVRGKLAKAWKAQPGRIVRSGVVGVGLSLKDGNGLALPAGLYLTATGLD